MIKAIWILLILTSFGPALTQEEKTSVTTSIQEQLLQIKQTIEDSVELTIPLVEGLLANPQYVLDSTEIISALTLQGRAHRKMGNYVKSISTFKIVYAYANIHSDSLLLAEAAGQIGNMNTFMGNMQEGQKYLLEVAEIYSQVGTEKDIAYANNGLAIFYDDMDQYDNAIDLYNLSLQQYITINDTAGMSDVYANMGLLYINLEQYELAEKHLRQQGKLDSLLQSKWGLGFYHNFMGLLRSEQKRHEEALQWYKTALEIRNKLPSQYNIADSRSGLSETYFALGYYDQSIIEANLILLRKEKHNSLTQQKGAYEMLSKAYEKKGLYHDALQFYKEHMTMSDSMYQRDMLSEIANKDALYQKAKQDEKITRLNANHEISRNKIANKNKVIALGAIALAIISLLLFFLYRLLKKVSIQKDQLSKSVKEKDLLLREIHHRVKNNLQLISSLLTLQSRSIDDETAIRAINEGKSRVRSMALIHQDLYSRENRTHVSLKDYITKLTHELFTTYKINNNKIELTTDIEQIQLDIDTVIPLGLIINELITNALKYAYPGDRSGKLNVALKEKNNKLILVVQDDGVGLDFSEKNEHSFGSSLISALTEQLGGHQKIESSNGTIITITFEDYGNL